MAAYDVTFKVNFPGFNFTGYLYTTAAASNPEHATALASRNLYRWFEHQVTVDDVTVEERG